MRLNVEITREDYADFSKHHFMKNGFRKSIILYSISYIIIQLYFLVNYGINLFAIIFSTVIFWLTCFLLIHFRLKSTKKTPLKDGSFLSDTEYVFSDEKILYKSKDSEGSLNWSIIKRFDIGKKAFYLYTDSLIAYVIPKRVFQNDEEMKAFQNLVERNIHKPINA